MNKHGDFIWYELMTPDAEAAVRFYGSVLDWSFGGSAEYREIKGSEGHVGGILPLTAGMQAGGARPGWLGYIGVDDVDAAVSAIEAAGGQTHLPPRDIPGVGRFAMVADPQGVPFYVMRGASDGTSHAFAAERPMIGHCAWNELSTTDPNAGFAFYSGLFGWTKDGGMDMGPLGKYEFLRHGPMIGAIMPKMPQQPAPAWSFYFRVADIDAAAAATSAGGGQIMHGPQEIPGGEYSLNALDPQGAAFAMVGPRKQGV
jgi:hypothetical protein